MKVGAVDLRVGGRIFATLASIKDGFGNLMLTPEMQAEFVAEAPDLFVPVAGGWGRMGATHIGLANTRLRYLAERGSGVGGFSTRSQENHRALRVFVVQ